MKKFLLIALLCVSGNVSAVSAYLDGNKLIEDCINPAIEDQATCSGYISGVSDATDIWEGERNFSAGICQPKGVSVGQIKRVVVKYLEAKPERLHSAASSLVINALKAAFPCTE